MTDAARVATMRAMASADLSAVTQAHLDCLELGFFGRLGPKFMAAYYESFVLSPFGFAAVAERDGKVIGHLVGTLDDSAHYRWVTNNRRRELAVIGVKQLARRPRLAASFIRTRAVKYIRGYRRLSQSPVELDTKPVGSLSHIVIHPAAQRSGLGSVLVNEFVDAAKGRPEIESLRLLTSADNTRAISFYEKLGWKLVGTKANPDGHDQRVFSFDLPR